MALGATLQKGVLIELVAADGWGGGEDQTPRNLPQGAFSGRSFRSGSRFLKSGSRSGWIFLRFGLSIA